MVSNGQPKDQATKPTNVSPSKEAKEAKEARSPSREVSPESRGTGKPEKKVLETPRERPAPSAPVVRPSVVVQAPSAQKAKKMYPWPRKNSKYVALSQRFSPPSGFKRRTVKKKSYAYWLRHLPLRPKGTSVRDYTGRVLNSSTAASSAVVDLDVGKRDLQQCVDTILRLRGEYLWWRGQKNKIAFRYAGGKYFGWKHWKKGLRPKRRRRRTYFKPGGRRGSSRKRFKAYMTFMFAMTGTMHHIREPRVKFKDLQAGHFFINPPPRPGALGHAVVLLDIAEDSKGQIRALIGEGYTPAQDFHILKTPMGKRWYDLDPSVAVQTPQWPSPFKWKDLARFKY